MKYIYEYKIKRDTVYRDNTVLKEKPYEVEVEKKVVPKWCWYLLVFNLSMVVLAGAYFYIKK